jgi:hypothetical protein
MNGFEWGSVAGLQLHPCGVPVLAEIGCHAPFEEIKPRRNGWLSLSHIRRVDCGLHRAYIVGRAMIVRSDAGVNLFLSWSTSENPESRLTSSPGVTHLPILKPLLHRIFRRSEYAAVVFAQVFEGSPALNETEQNPGHGDTANNSSIEFQVHKPKSESGHKDCDDSGPQ